MSGDAGVSTTGTASTQPSAMRALPLSEAAALDPPSDVHASADYRRHLAEVLAVRALRQAQERS